MPWHSGVSIPVGEQRSVVITGKVFDGLGLVSGEHVGVLGIGFAGLLKHAVEDLALAVESGICRHPSHGMLEGRNRLEFCP